MHNFGNEAVSIFPFQLISTKKPRNLSLCKRYIGQRLPCRTISIIEGAAMEYTHKPVDELSFTDDFMFGTVMKNKAFKRDAEIARLV